MPQKIMLYTSDRLYDHPTRILLAHKRREYETLPVDSPTVPSSFASFTHETKAPVYFEAGEVPFVSCDMVGTEAYIEERFAGHHTLPNDVQARFRMIGITNDLVNEAYPKISDINKHSADLTKIISDIARHMDEGGHIFSEELTFFDVFLLPIMWRLRKAHPGFKNTSHPFSAFARNYFSLPAFTETLEPLSDV